jgi:hypothetical protein
MCGARFVFRLDSSRDAGLHSRPAVEHSTDAFVSFVPSWFRDLQALR